MPTCNKAISLIQELRESYSSCIMIFMTLCSDFGLIKLIVPAITFTLLGAPIL